MTKDIILDSTTTKYWLRGFILTNADASCGKFANTGAISPASAPVTLL
tara:strand:- start:284 stop:427 length:144 start_codon:yes stop_codon:yes gene_type:complete